MRVSILVLLDLPLKLLLASLSCHAMFMFQSLFYWIYLSNSLRYFDSGWCCEVSILVLLDLPLKLGYIVCLSLRMLCFNPCFTGFTSQTTITELVRLGVEVFQSLFYWIYLSNLLGKTVEVIQLACFNPCFTGFTSQTGGVYHEYDPKREFQSLFYWIYLSNLWYPGK